VRLTDLSDGKLDDAEPNVDELLSSQTDSNAISRNQLLLSLDLGENATAQRPFAQDERKDNAEQPGVVFEILV
jgi:hypothetical protein